mgnify:FL=1
MESIREKRLLQLLFFGVLIGALDISIVGPALPAIQNQFGIDERASSWIFASYVLANLVSTPIMAKLSDLYGRKNLYVLNMAIFGVGSLLVVLSQSFEMLVIARGIQGIGGGGIFPVASAVIGDSFPVEKRGRALGMLGAVFGIAFLLGPLVAGVLLVFSWHWLFVINIPFVLLIIFFAFKLFPKEKPHSTKQIDWKGIVLLSIMIVSVSIGFNSIETENGQLVPPHFWTILLLATPFVMLPFFVNNERKQEEPIVRMGLFRSRQVQLVSILSFASGLLQSALVFLAPFLVAIYSVSFSAASFMLVPAILSLAVSSPISGRIIDKMGSRFVLLIGLATTTFGFVILTLFGGLLPGFYTALVFIGLGMGSIAGAPLRYIMLNESEQREKGSAQGLIRVFMGVGQIVGGTLTGGVIAAFPLEHQGHFIAYGTIAVFSGSMTVLSIFLKSKEKERATSKQVD